MGSTTSDFYESQKDKSRIKSYIVTEFFKAYFSIINYRFGEEIWYLDFFCGLGYYKDGNKSTPMLLLDTIENFHNDDIRNKLRMVFNDKDPKLIAELDKNIRQHPAYGKLKYPPEILNLSASQIDLSRYTFGNTPIFSFVDPWGYKDTSASQVWELIKNKGSDCVLFFNSNRILQDIGKDENETDFRQIFGAYFDDACDIQKSGKYDQQTKAELLLKLFAQNLYNTVHENNKCKLYILPFGFKSDENEKISHYIVFITKNHKAVVEMRKVMGKFNNTFASTFGYDSKTALQISLFDREEGSVNDIIELMGRIFNEYPSFYKGKMNLSVLSERLDDYSMHKNYFSLSYPEGKIKSAVKELDNKGFVRIIEPVGKKWRDRITNDREFYIEFDKEGK